MVAIYITGFIISFLFMLLKEVESDFRKDINGVPMKMDWGDALFVSFFFSLLWPILIFGVVVSIKQSI
jgi:hypothetical protein